MRGFLVMVMIAFLPLNLYYALSIPITEYPQETVNAIAVGILITALLHIINHSLNEIVIKQQRGYIQFLENKLRDNNGDR